MLGKCMFIDPFIEFFPKLQNIVQCIIWEARSEIPKRMFFKYWFCWTPVEGEMKPENA